MTDSFAPILSAVRCMDGFSGRWFVAGGWAIDLFLGDVTRRHADIEIGIYRADQRALHRHLTRWSLEKAIQTPEGGKWVPWEPGEELRLPIHQIRAQQAAADCPEIEFFLNERSDTDWLSRRQPQLTRTLGQESLVSSLGIPILAPEIQLLFKAKQTRDKDQADFECSLPRLSRQQRDWLDDALRTYHREHPWLAVIAQYGKF